MDASWLIDNCYGNWYSQQRPLLIVMVRSSAVDGRVYPCGSLIMNTH